ALRWSYAWIAVGLALVSSAFVLAIGLLPNVEIYDSHLRIGGTTIPWPQIRRVDCLRQYPLCVRLTLSNKKRTIVFFAGPVEAAIGLLRHLRRYAREALIDGVPHKQLWGETLSATPDRKQLASPKYPLLLPDDEAEIERMFQKLKAVGHLDPTSQE